MSTTQASAFHHPPMHTNQQKAKWQRCRGCVEVLWCHSHVVCLDFEGSVSTYACFQCVLQAVATATWCGSLEAGGTFYSWIPVGNAERLLHLTQESCHLNSNDIPAVAQWFRLTSQFYSIFHFINCKKVLAHTLQVWLCKRYARLWYTSLQYTILYSKWLLVTTHWPSCTQVSIFLQCSN